MEFPEVSGALRIEPFTGPNGDLELVVVLPEGGSPAGIPLIWCGFRVRTAYDHTDLS